MVLSIDEVGGILDGVCEEFPEELFQELNGGVLLLEGALALLAAALGVTAACIPLTNWANKVDMRMYEDGIDGNRRFGAFYRLVDYPVGKDMRTYDISGMVMDKFMRNEKTRNAQFKKNYMRGQSIRSLISVVNLTTVLLAYAFVGLKAMAGLITVGAVSMQVGAITAFAGAVSQGIEQLGHLDLHRKYMKEFAAFLDTPSEKYNGTLPVEKRNDGDYDLEFRDVSFRYPNQEQWSLRHVSCRLPKGEKLLEKLTDLLGEFFCMPVTRGGRLLEAYVESERENLADMIRSDINDKRSYAARRLRESSGLSLSDLLAVDTHGFGLDLDRLETLDDVFDVVLRSIEDHGHLLGLQVGLHVLHALAERRHVVHDLLHAVVAVDVGAEHHGRRRFLRALLLLRGAYARAHQGDQAQQNNLFHCNRF